MKNIPATSYHPGKQAGDFTRSGGQTMVLLRSLALHGRFDPASFAAERRAFRESPRNQSCRDGVTRATLENLLHPALNECLLGAAVKAVGDVRKFQANT